MARNQLSRDPDNAMLGGVCAGIARHYGFDVTIVRIVWLVLTVVSAGTSIILYIAAWVIMPREDEVQNRAEPPSDRGGAHRPMDTEGETLPTRERFVESGRVLLTHVRQGAEEIGRVARGERVSSSDGAQETAHSSGAQSHASPSAGNSGTTETGTPQPVEAPTTDPSAPTGSDRVSPSHPGAAAGGSVGAPSETERGSSQRFVSGETPTAADPPTESSEENPAPPPQSPI